MKLRTLLSLIVLSSLSIGCVKGDKGDTGPQGPAGTNGTDGNANVQSGSVTVLPGDWSWDAANKLSTIDISYAAITPDIISKGTVSAFMTNTTGYWIALPYTYWGNPSITYNFAYKSGHIAISIQKTDNTSHFPTLSLKVVVITASQKAAHPKTDWKNYDEVMSVINETSSTVQ